MIKPSSLVIAFLLAIPPPLILGGTYDMAHGVCFEKDDVPVDVDALYDDECVDVYGNMYSLDSELYSCCDCFRYKCEKIEYWGKQMKVGWVMSVSDQCCQNCNGTVYLPNTIISTTNLEDDCLTIKTEVCRVRPDMKTAVIEQEFSYRNCCNDNNKTLQYLGAEVPEPSTCSIRTCEYDPAWPHSVWISEKKLEGCDCCLLPNGTLVPDGATWWDNSVKPPQLRECCRGQIVTPTQPPQGGRPGVLIVGGTGKVGDKVEVFNPFANKSCALPDLYKGENRSQSTLCSGLLCGGLEPYALRSCLKFEGDKFYPTKVTLIQKRRYDVCWTRDDGVQLLGGPGNGLASLLSSEIVKFDGSSSSSSFPLPYKLDNACGIDLGDHYLVTGGYDSSVPGAAKKNVSFFYTTGYANDFNASLNVGRFGHACGKYDADDGSLVLFVVGGWNDMYLQLDSTEIYRETDNVWKIQYKSLPIPTIFLRAATINNIVYAFGGKKDANEIFDQILIFDPKSITWSYTGKMIYPRDRHAIQVLWNVDEYCS